MGKDAFPPTFKMRRTLFAKSELYVCASFSLVSFLFTEPYPALGSIVGQGGER